MNIFKNKNKNPPKRVSLFRSNKTNSISSKIFKKPIKLKKNTIKRFH
jgi:hypothetical protein